MMFRGREMAHKDIGQKVMDKLVKDIESLGRVDREPRMLGRSMVLILSPK